jgi:histone chaperone ASF1
MMIMVDLEWKVIYVGSADNEKYDQVLDSVLVGPVRRGSSKFVFQAPSPEPSSIPNKDLLGVTVVLLTCSYADQEFIKIGYYLNNEYENPEWNENPPEQIQPDSLMRNILADKPRVTRFEINWDA